MSSYQGLEQLGYPEDSKLAGDLSTAWPNAAFGRKPRKSKKPFSDHDVLGSDGHSGATHNDEGWIFSYSDMVTNLLMFFIMLVAVSKIDESKYQELTEGMQKGSKKTENARRSVANFSSAGQTPSEMIMAASEMLDRMSPAEMSDKKSEFAKYNELKNKVTNMLKAYGLKNYAPPHQQNFEFIVPTDKMFSGGRLTQFGNNILATISVKVRELPLGSMRIQVDVFEVSPEIRMQPSAIVTTIGQQMISRGVPSDTIAAGSMFRSKNDFKNKIRFKVSRDVQNDRGEK